MTVVEKVFLSTAIEQELVSPKSSSFGCQAKGKLVRIPAPVSGLSEVGISGLPLVLLRTRRRGVYTDYSWAGVSREPSPLPNTC